ncbi:MAG: TetR/AcrR family transcriptional regulator [Acidimicrobiales bacterium]
MATRDDLIDATQTLLSEKGYEATSPRDILQASGAGQGSFYHHFESKADLASVALGTLADEMCGQFDEMTASYEAGPVHGYLELQRDALAGCRIGRIAMESSLSDERIREPIARYFEYLRDRLSVAFSEIDTGLDAEALADLAIAAVQGGFVVARATGDPAAMQHATSALVDLVDMATSRRSDMR